MIYDNKHLLRCYEVIFTLMSNTWNMLAQTRKWDVRLITNLITFESKLRFKTFVRFSALHFLHNLSFMISFYEEHNCCCSNTDCIEFLTWQDTLYCILKLTIQTWHNPFLRNHFIKKKEQIIVYHLIATNSCS